MTAAARHPVPDPGYPDPVDMRPLTLGRHRQTRLLTGSVAVAGDRFWASWKARRADWLSRGYGLRKGPAGWILDQWLICSQNGDISLTDIGIRRLERHAREEFPIEVEPPAPPAPAFDPAALPPLPDGLEDKLFDYQRPSARLIFRSLTAGPQEFGRSGAVDCSDLGTGKTYSSLAAALATGLEVGVVCPLSVIGTYPRHGNRGSGWQGAFAHFGRLPAFVINYESLRTGNRRQILTRDKTAKKKAKAFQWQIDPRDHILIWDEAHLLKNASLNRAMAMAAIKQGFANIFVSGTMADSPLHMAATGFGIGLHEGTRRSYEQFLAAHGCSVGADGWQFHRGPRGAQALARLHSRIFPARGSRIRIADLGDAFPPTQILCEAAYVERREEIEDAFQEAQSTIQRLREQGDKSEGELRLLELSTYMHAWHESERLKVPDIVRMANEELENGRSVVIFVNFTDVRIDLMDKLRTRCAIYGGQNKAHREACIADFQADRARILVANLTAGGVGISLHDVNGDYPRSAIILPHNNAVAMSQAFGRIHRAGGKSRSRQIVFFAADTIEEQICEAVRRKMASIATLNDGDLHPANIF